MQCADRTRVRVALAKAGVSLVEITRSEGLDYARVHRVLGGYARSKPGELERLLEVIERRHAPQVDTGESL